MKTADEIVRMVTTGGSVIVDASQPTEDLLRIAGAAERRGGKIIIRGAHRKPTDELVRIASVGKGNVTFDLTEA